MQKESDDIPQFEPGKPDHSAIAMFLLTAAIAVFAVVKIIMHFVK